MNNLLFIVVFWLFCGVCSSDAQVFKKLWNSGDYSYSVKVVESERIGDKPYIKAWIKKSVIPEKRTNAIKRLIETLKRYGINDSGYLNFDHSLTLYVFRCGSGSFAMLEAFDYDTKGSVLNSRKFYGPDLDYESVAPETIIEGLLTDVCAQYGPK